MGRIYVLTPSVVENLKNSEKLGRWENGLIGANKVVIWCTKKYGLRLAPFSCKKIARYNTESCRWVSQKHPWAMSPLFFLYKTCHLLIVNNYRKLTSRRRPPELRWQQWSPKYSRGHESKSPGGGAVPGQSSADVEGAGMARERKIKWGVCYRCIFWGLLTLITISKVKTPVNT